MKGVLLAAGSGTRLLPLTKVTNKQLLPVGPYPAVYYPLHTLMEMGITDVLVIVNPVTDVMSLLGSGSEFGLTLTYRVQDQPGGIAQAVGLAERFAAGDSIAVVLGDNIFEDPMSAHRELYESTGRGGMVFLRDVPDPERFGVAEIGPEGRVLGIEEKPKQPKSSLAVTGLYLYDNGVFDIIRTLKPSGRGELEITDVNNAYLREGALSSVTLHGYWSDAGTFEAMHRAAHYVHEHPFHWFDRYGL
jgi:glucose-1-phosphate thymidylyltransferase